MSWFIKKRQQKIAVEAKTVRVPEGLWIKCEACRELIYRAELANTLRLLRLPGPLQEQIALGKLGVGHGKVLLGVEDVHLQEQLAHAVIQEQLSVRALEAKLQHLQKAHKPKSRKKHPHAVFIKAAAEELTTAWSTKVEIKSKGKSGTVVLHFGSEGELDRLFEALKHGPKLGVRR